MWAFIIGIEHLTKKELNRFPQESAEVILRKGGCHIIEGVIEPETGSGVKTTSHAGDYSHDFNYLMQFKRAAVLRTS